jgi:hypothetical protein
MAIPLLMHRRGTGLLPSDQLAEEDLAELKEGVSYLVEVRKPRSLPHHRLLFGLLRKVAKSTPTPLSEKALLSWVKVRTGHVEHVPLGFGRSYEAPASIDFASMDQADFRVFFDKVVELICTEIVPGLDHPTLAAEIDAMLTERKAAA